MTAPKRRQQYGIDIATADPSKKSAPARGKVAEPVRKAELPSDEPLVGDRLVKAGQDLMENGA
jgi:hypothetical protein